MPAELFSVVIPAYNAEAYIAGTLQSAICQVKPGVVDVDIVVVDDRSTDATVTAVQKLAEKFEGKIRVMQQPENRGPAAARNAGLGQARGDFICFLDADD